MANSAGAGFMQVNLKQGVFTNSADGKDSVMWSFGFKFFLCVLLSWFWFCSRYYRWFWTITCSSIWMDFRIVLNIVSFVYTLRYL